MASVPRLTVFEPPWELPVDVVIKPGGEAKANWSRQRAEVISWRDGRMFRSGWRFVWVPRWTPTARVVLVEHPRAGAEVRWARALDLLLKAAN